MKFSFAVAALAAVGASAKTIENEYIVQLAAPSNDAAKIMGMTAKHFLNTGLSAQDIMYEYNINNGEFVGYAFKGDQNTMLRISEMAEVRSIEANQEVTAYQSCENLSSGSWGLSRTSNGRTSGNMDFPARAGEGTISYVLDTGINISHQCFGGRAELGFKAEQGWSDEDRNGHGTHVAGTMVCDTYGFARAGRTVAVKVLGDNGSGSFAGVIAGIDYTASDCSRRDVGTCVGNMSLGGGRSTAVNAAVDAANNAGVVMVVAAGNDARDAMNYSPASATGAFTVGSSTISDSRSSFSNFGTKIDVFAPGSNIASAWIGSNTATRTISGTSMASPHVAGIAQVYIGANPGASVSQVKAALKSNVYSGAVSDSRSTTSDLLKYTC